MDQTSSYKTESWHIINGTWNLVNIRDGETVKKRETLMQHTKK